MLSTQSGPVRATERYVGHQRHFEKEDLLTLLRDAGWAPVRAWNAGFPFHGLSKWLANRRPTATIERFSVRPYGPAEILACWTLRLLFKLNSNRSGAQLFAVAQRG